MTRAGVSSLQWPLVSNAFFYNICCSYSWHKPTRTLLNPLNGHYNILYVLCDGNELLAFNLLAWARDNMADYAVRETTILKSTFKDTIVKVP